VSRIILTAAAALLAVGLLLVPAAEACISCNYTPPVANTPQPSAKPSKKAPRVEADAKERSARPAKKRSAKREKTIPKEVAPEKTEEAAKTVPVEPQTDTETSGVSTAAVDEEAPSATTDEPKSDGGVGCKKFSPTIGKTVTVPCE